jgi:protein O-GlcNAc transferase
MLEFIPGTFANYVHSLVTICDWTHRDENFRTLYSVIVEDLNSGRCPVVQPFHAFMYPFTAAEKRVLAERYAAMALGNVARFPALVPWTSSSQRIRIGYVSSDFGNHPLCHLM